MTDYTPIVTLPATEDAMPFVALSRALAGLTGSSISVSRLLGCGYSEAQDSGKHDEKILERSVRPRNFHAKTSRTKGHDVSESPEVVR